MGDVDPVDADTPPYGLGDPEERESDGGLAGASSARDADLLPAVDVAGEVAENQVEAGTIPGGVVVEGDVAVHQPRDAAVLLHFVQITSKQISCLAGSPLAASAPPIIKKTSLSSSGDAEAQDPGSLPVRGYAMMAAMLRGTCPAIGKWSDLEFMLSKHCIMGEINLLS